MRGGDDTIRRDARGEVVTGIAHLGLDLEAARGGVVEVHISAAAAKVLDHRDTAIRGEIYRLEQVHPGDSGRHGRSGGAGWVVAASGEAAEQDSGEKEMNDGTPEPRANVVAEVHKRSDWRVAGSVQVRTIAIARAARHLLQSERRHQCCQES
jgi:hypothetical protein